MDAGLTIPQPAGDDQGDWLESYLAGFEEKHLAHYGYLHPERPLEVVALRVEATGSASQSLPTLSQDDPGAPASGFLSPGE